MSLRALTTFTRAATHKSSTTNFRLLVSNRTTSSELAHISRKYSVETTKTMRFIRFQKATDNKVRVGVLSEDGKSVIALDHALPNDMIELIKSNVSAETVESAIKFGKWEPLTNDIKLLAPVQNPEKVACIGLNYLGHCKEQKKEPPKEPMFFSKFASAITGPTGDVILHEATQVSLLSAPVIW